jgi:hypothetical protein
MVQAPSLTKTNANNYFTYTDCIQNLKKAMLFHLTGSNNNLNTVYFYETQTKVCVMKPT